MNEDILNEIENDRASEILVELARDFLVLTAACIDAAMLLKMRRGMSQTDVGSNG